jgi:hypothetical protein
MVFRPLPGEAIELLRAILLNVEEATDTESSDLVYLRRLILERITELEAAQRGESPKSENSTTHRHAA